MGPVGCPETSVRICHYSLRNNPEERSSDLPWGGSLNHTSSGCVYVLNVILCITVLSMLCLNITLPTSIFALSSLPFDFLSNAAQVRLFVSQPQHIEVSSATNHISGAGISI
jgi:hypothetical protein